MAKRNKMPSADDLFGPRPGSLDTDTWEGIMTGPAATPSSLTITTTSTTNPQRPRTLAAGYNYKTKTMTVVFRKNVWWNYYDVPEDMWENFKRAESKGAFLKESGLDAWDNMGRADMSLFSKSEMQSLDNLVSRAEDVQQKTDGQQEESLSMGRQFNPSIGHERLSSE